MFPMIKPEKGLWYIVVNCYKCSSMIFLFPDLTEGKGVLNANYIVTCPRCSHKGGYQARHYFHSGHTDANALQEISSPQAPHSPAL
jgi:hypothetical protein